MDANLSNRKSLPHNDATLPSQRKKGLLMFGQPTNQSIARHPQFPLLSHSPFPCHVKRIAKRSIHVTSLAFAAASHLQGPHLDLNKVSSFIHTVAKRTFSSTSRRESQACINLQLFFAVCFPHHASESEPLSSRAAYERATD